MKPLDLTKPVRVCTGWPVRIFCTDRKNTNGRTVAGLVTRGNVEELRSWTDQGAATRYGESSYDLVNVPVKREGWALVGATPQGLPFVYGARFYADGEVVPKLDRFPELRPVRVEWEE